MSVGCGCWVILVDLDGTIVGDVSPHVAQYTMEMEGGKRGGAQNNPWLTLSLRGGLLRPGFADFARYFAAGSTAELFLYTASTPEWARALVEAIEGEIGATFNRPLLTRDDCVVGGGGLAVKSLASVRPKVYRALKARYGLTSPDQLRDRMLLIDNTPGVLLESGHQVLCPTYTWQGPHDPLFASITPQRLVDELPRVAEVLRTHNLTSSSGSGGTPLEVLGMYQHTRGHHARRFLTHQSTHLKDPFWRRTLRAVRAAMRRGPPTALALATELNATVQP